MKKELQLHYGQAVNGDMRFDRPDLHDRLISLIETGSGVKMFGLRRIGKSTLREVVREHCVAQGRPCAYVDAQGSTTLAHFLTKLANALPDKKLITSALGFLGSGPAKAILETVLKGSALEEGQVSAYWQHISQAMKNAAEKDGQPLILIVDEFSYLIDNLTKDESETGRRDADNLLASLREWRDQKVKMLLTGSLGLTGIARKRGLNIEHLNDLQNFDVPELTEDQTRDFIRQAVSEKWTDAHIESFLVELGALFPSFVVKGLIEIGPDTPCSPEQIGEIFAQRVRPELHGIFLTQFDRRFDGYSDLPEGEQKSLMTPVLKAVLTSVSPVSQENLSAPAPFTRIDLGRTLEILQDDGFLTASETRDGDRLWRPASRLALLWWKRARLA